MAILRAKNIRDMRAEDRSKKLKELKLELFKEKGKIDVGGISDNPGKIRELRRTIARILTIDKEM
ncbi:MAG: 50S ribosomal protein L29 [Candidatus Aenigmarchaeota archaeon]|nr:50S ribosomal protein L29 [Candidatus Aenigmarchaeota archaeon]MCK5063585.1 50S ribosomal protein L29 [Candidatus Aenigmarchaeota archaeon]MCK5234575.1 50S ribosomal protein L29 [Candidatus Aenigmarchaeota archaeon]MCK5289370.1 50S ribosomal protein L29 [Candidatus Aenigmarchaeota archaeon]MCK5373170.1 50S ribosomal protein L29 [Candidatus Aenigmarchaeota archaeon]